MCKPPWVDALSPSARCCDEAARVDTDDSETLIFVDVDGVLNVGIADPGQRAMELNDSNIKIARDNWETRMQLSKDFRNSVERVIAVCERHPDGSADPLAAHVARDGTSLSELLVWRLAHGSSEPRAANRWSCSAPAGGASRAACGSWKRRWAATWRSPSPSAPTRTRARRVGPQKSASSPSRCSWSGTVPRGGLWPGAARAGCGCSCWTISTFSLSVGAVSR
ncbi:unnamed protein product [Prorocentrum cordatum]|uniref:Protein-serine/threonine phosphatase n=1 Tax=Prorocentrum cordatum TaxID=2364126 RepID=A0ABN9P866_9DINO|nr:unnamed protein product [Polarella glacialis]